MKKKKTNLNQKLAEKARRDNEIKTYGKLISLRPTIAMNSKKTYKRNKKVDINEDY